MKVIILIVLLMASAYFSFPAPLTKDLKITVMEKRIRDFSLDGLTLVFYVNITNSSSKDYYLSGYEYRFIVNQTDYLQLQTGLDEGLMIEEKGETLVAFPVKITYENLFRVIPEMRNELHATCNLVGWARFSDKRRERGKIALAFTGDFPIFWEPERIRSWGTPFFRTRKWFSPASCTLRYSCSSQHPAATFLQW